MAKSETMMKCEREGEREGEREREREKEINSLFYNCTLQRMSFDYDD